MLVPSSCSSFPPCFLPCVLVLSLIPICRALGSGGELPRGRHFIFFLLLQLSMTHSCHASKRKWRNTEFFFLIWQIYYMCLWWSVNLLNGKSGWKLGYLYTCLELMQECVSAFQIQRNTYLKQDHFFWMGECSFFFFSNTLDNEKFYQQALWKCKSCWWWRQFFCLSPRERWCEQRVEWSCVKDRLRVDGFD